ncbi:MAG TPA: hypothetical protein VIX80_06660 [Candidatus Kapabacteria bacterium]
MKLILVLFASLIMLSSCSEDSVSDGSSSTTKKPWVQISPSSLTGTVGIGYTFWARVNEFNQDELRFDWYFGEGDTIQMGKTSYWNLDLTHQFKTPGVYRVSVTARDVFADTIVGVGTSIATITN